MIGSCCAVLYDVMGVVNCYGIDVLVFDWIVVFRGNGCKDEILFDDKLFEFGLLFLIVVIELCLYVDDFVLFYLGLGDVIYWVECK